MRVRVVVAAFVAASLAACSGSRLRCGACAPAAPCAAEPAPCAPVTAPCRPPPDVGCACAASFFDGYVPTVPVSETRVAFTALIFPPTPFLGTEGEADTPRRGRAGFNVSRIDDERRFRDDQDTQFELDGEIQVVTLEWVSPRQSLTLCGGCLPYHVGLSLTAYTAHPALFDGLRNFTEAYIVGRDPGIEAAHQTGGQEISATTLAGDRTEFLDTSPLWKAKGVLKVPLPDFDVGGRPGRWAASLGVTAPAFGSHSDSGNDHVVPEAVLAVSVPLAERWRLTGAASLTLPGPSRNFEDLGIEHRALVAAGMANVEWWVTPRFAVALGMSVNGAYTRDSGLPTDLFSFYTNLGVLYRLSERAEVHLLFSENPGTGIVTDGDANADYNLNTQRDADFTVTLGATFAF